ncbi:MAG: hypothetical protein JNL72_00475, partial [Flavipsychrobacter sp.]|nr:hypothetical protein [Flavipsychrobacter sp.]
MFKKITLFCAGVAWAMGTSAQCPTVSCPGDITVNKDPNACGAVVTYTTPVGTDPCYTVPVTQTFNYTGSAQTWTVPPGVTSVNVDLRGAGGGQSRQGTTTLTAHIPGTGGRIMGTLSVTPGQVLNIYVGQKGVNSSGSSGGAGGWNGGGTAAGNSSYGGGGGGGASDIRIGGTALTDRVIVAAGGGGAAYNYSANDNGGHGGGLTGNNGMSNNGYNATYCGLGGTQTAGGAPGSGATAGTLGTGGNGASGTNTGGGGGGGYYGGGGSLWAGGGGGSSWASSTLVTSVTNTTGGGSTSNGQVTISYVPQATTAQISGLPSGSLFPIGTTVNTFVTAGGSGATDTCSFVVTVINPSQPAINSQPVDSQMLCAGGTVTLSASTVNFTSHQWYLNGVAVTNGGNVTGANTATLNINNIQPNQFGTYVLRCAATCDVMWTDSSYVLFSAPASITAQPQATQNICVGNAITVTAGVSSAASVQWYKNGQPMTNGGDVSGVTTNSLSILNADASDIGAYTLIATGFSACASATSNASNVNVNTAIGVIGVPPTNISMCSGGPVNIDVVANGAAGYQWYRNGQPLNNGGDVTGATSANLVVNNADATDAGTYHVVVLANPGCNNAVVPSTLVQINNTPTIISQPQPVQQVCEGTTLVVNVVSVDGTGFQWYRNGIPLSNGGNVTGATGAILQVANT